MNAKSPDTFKHTPGPWLIHDAENHPYIAAVPAAPCAPWDRPIICLMYEDVTPEDSVTFGPWLKNFDNAEANARLIAAAPELLELARMVAAGNTDQVDLEAAARAAIAKAEGREVPHV